MSDADDQLGGRGGPTGLDPSEAEPGKDNAAPRGDRAADQAPRPGADDEDRADDEARQSFPASDPPGNY